jgi:hypothetical protein
MKRIGWGIAVFLTVLELGLSRTVYADDLTPEVAPLPTDAPVDVKPITSTPPPNPLLAQRATDIVKKSMRVIKEDEGVINLSLTANGQSLAPKTQILFFRRKGSRMEVIADGVVTGDIKNKQGIGEILVDLNRDTIIKYPEKGDYAIPMSDPNATAEGDKKDEFNFLVPEDPVDKTIKDRPGYMEYGMGLLQGTYRTTSSNGNNADDSKDVKGYRFKNTHFAYWLDFLPIGIEMDSHAGNFPTATYYQNTVSSTESISTLSFGYRIHTLLDRHIAPVVKITSLSDTFTTSNPDEHVLNTKISGTGVGFRLNIDFVSPVWKPEKAKFGLALQQVFTEFNYFPSVTAVDGAISRGTSSGSSASLYKVGATALIYVGFIPIFKRFVLQTSYGVRTYNLGFSGATTSESVANAYQIPTGYQGKMIESDLRFFIGIRIDDPLKLLTSPEKEKKSKKDLIPK